MRQWVTVWVIVGVVLLAGAHRAAGAQRAPGHERAEGPLVAPGTMATDLQLVNRQAGDFATMVTTLYHQRGNPPIPFTSAGVPPGGAAHVRLGLGELPTGPYGGISTAAGGLGAIARFNWTASGGYAAANNPAAGTDVMVPWVLKGFQRQTSVVLVQNADPTREQTVELALTPVGATEPLRVVTQTVRAGTSVTVDFGRDPRFSNLLPGTVASLRVRAPVGAAVLSLVDVEGSQRAVYALQGVPVEQADTTLFAPLVRTGARDTWLAVANPSNSAVEVTVTYRGIAGSCAGQTIRHGGRAVPVPPGSSTVFDQGPGGSSWPSGASGLPPGCAATATLASAGGPVVAVVVDRDGGGAAIQLAGAYDALRPADGGTLTTLPLVYRQFRAGGLTTAVAAMNLGTGPAAVVAELFWRQGEPLTGCCAATIPPGQAWLWSLGDVSGFPEDSFGSVRLRSDQPLVVLAMDESGAGTVDVAMHAGLSLIGTPRPPTPATPATATPTPATPPATPTPSTAFSPLVMFNGAFRPPPAPTLAPPPGEQWRLWLPAAQK